MTLHAPARSRILRALCLLAILAAARFVHADEVVDRLVRLVGRDAGLCVEVPRLDETLTAFERGDFFHRLERSKIYAEWKSGKDYERVASLAALVEKFTGKPAREFVREIFGTAVVVAAYAERGPKMSGILLSEATSREALESAVAAWNRLEPPRIEAIPFAGRTYYKRTCAPKPGRAPLTLFYATLDRTLLLSDHERIVRRTLTLADQAAPHASLLDSPAYQQARQSLGPRCAARAYINPRAFDAMIGVEAAEIQPAPAAQTAALAGPAAEAAKGTNSAACRTIQAAWRSCEWLAIGVETDRGIVLQGVAHYSSDRLSPGARGLIQSMAGPPQLLRLAPADAFVVLACRQPFGKLLRAALTGQARRPPSADWESFRQVSRGLLLGLDPLDDVLPAFGENFGGYLVPRSDAKPDELPFDGLLAAELPRHESRPNEARRHEAAPNEARRHEAAPNEARRHEAPGAARLHSDPSSGVRPSPRDAIDNALNTGLSFAAAYFNMSSTGVPAVVRSEAEQGRAARVRWIDGLGPYKPAYGLTSRYLVLATSPQAVRNFSASDAADEARPAGRANSSEHSPIDRLAKRYFPTENQVLVVDTAAIRRFLQARGPELIQHAIRVRPIAVAHAEKALAKFLDVAGLFDTVFAAARLGDGSARVVIGGIVNGPSAPESAAIDRH